MARVIKFKERKYVPYLLGGIAGIVLYKTFEAISNRFPDLIAFVDDLVSDKEDIHNSPAPEYDESIGEVI